MNDHTEQFKSAMVNAGLIPPDVIEPGVIHKFPGADKGRANKAGRCFMFPDERGGWFEDYSNGGEQINWQASGGKPYSNEERLANIERSKAAKAAYEAEKAKAQADAATEAEKRFKAALPCTSHPYRTRKGIKPHGVKIEGSNLLIPIRIDGVITSLQTISPDGEKRFLSGGEIKGGYFGIGKPAGQIIVCEGFATGASIHEATGSAVAVAFNSGNLAVVAGAMRFKYPDLQIVLAADDDSLTAGNPGLTKARAAALAIGGYLALPNFGDNRPDGATDFNDLHQLFGLEAVKRCIDNATLLIAACASDTGDTGSNDQWPELQPLIAKMDAQEYPLDALPVLVRCAVEEVAGFVKAPTPLIATLALGALSLAIQAHADVARAEKLSGQCSLFLLAIADSGERKSSCDGYFTKAIRDYEALQQEAAKPLIKAYRSEHDAWEAQRSGIKEAIKSAARKSGGSSAALIGQLHDLDKGEPTAPRVPRLIYGDATPEALTYALAKQWPSGGILSNEAGVVFGGHAMGRDSAMRNMGTLNQLWDGTAAPVERRSSESYTVRGARLTMSLQVQEATIREFFSATKGLARGTGFLARFLVSWPQSTQGTRHFTEAPANWPSMAAFNNRLTAILERPAPIDIDGSLHPVMLQLSPEAKAAWIVFHDTIESELSTGRELFDVRDVASKTADNAARLAALFHVFGGRIGAIGVDDLESAARITLWHLTEGKRFLGEIAMPAELANPARLESWLIEYCKREGVDQVPTREVQRMGPGGLRDKSIIMEVVIELSELGRARLVQDGKKKSIQVRPELLAAAS